ncbi:conserved hypothetical protein [Thiomonas sp. X19]|uniref:DUF2147 domain-containing protein n=1 Tax=Thiomonas sp. X19 TaxID=1050370 RepID=UPI000B751625|nr:conserved hypothetical protein [Thiomonas sp. X19]
MSETRIIPLSPALRHDTGRQRLTQALARLLFALCLAGMASVSWAQALGIAGTWKTIDDKTGKPKALIRIVEQPDGSYSGTIIKSLVPGADPHRICTLCSGALKDQPMIGLTILTGLRQDAEHQHSFSGGEIVDPDSGKTYHCNARLVDDGAKLDVRGYIGISLFGRTQTWVREP